MHVELRVSEVSKACCLEPESFFRVKQLLASHKRVKSFDGTDTPLDAVITPSVVCQQKKFDLLSLYGNTASGLAAQKREERSFCPKLRVQFVLERVVKMETSDLATSRDRDQHEKQVKSKWDGSGIRTQRFSACPREVLLASLPASVMDCVVKIRLLQLPPTLPSTGAGARLDEAIGCHPDDDEECHHDTPLCIGVTKITLKELMSVRGGVRMTLQAKRTITSLVEELNLNTVATNAMFGKDVGGSAFLTFQVVPYAFGKVPLAKLLLYKEPVPGQNSGMDDNDLGSVSRQSSIGGKSLDRQNISGHGSAALTRSVDQFDTPAVRFMLVPYMALVDTALRLHDAISWRRPVKTLLLLLILGVVMWGDILDVGLVMGGAVELFFFLRSMSIFYYTPLADSHAQALVSPLTSARSSTVYLYGRQNVLLNTLVRCRLFFANGLQEDCFYEAALVLHLLRRRQRTLLVQLALVMLFLTVISVETLFALILFTCFVLYPVSVRLPNLRGAPKNPNATCEDDATSTLRHAVLFFRRAYRLNRPMQITRVVKIAAPRRVPTPPPRRITDATASVPGLPSLARLPSTTYSYSGPSAAFMHSLHDRTGTNNTDVADAASTTSGAFAVSESSSAKKPMSNRGVPFAHRRAMTMDGVGPIERPPQPLLLDGTHILRNASAAPLSFVIISFTCDLAAFTDGVSSMGATTMMPRGSPSAALVGRLVRHMAFASSVASSTAGGTDRQAVFQRFFNETFNLLFFIRRNVTYQAYITPKSLSAAKPVTSEVLRSDIFVRPGFLVEQGVDDSVTAALLALPKDVSGPQVIKLPASPGADNSARALALMGAALLQGSRLSVYTPGATSRNCSLIVPLQAGSDHIEQRMISNPCPPPLFNALEEMWRNKQGASPPGEMTISADMVLQVISTYRNQQAAGSTLLAGSPHGANTMAGPSTSSVVPDEPPHALTQRRSFFQTLTKTNTSSHPAGNHTPRLSQTFYGTLPEARRTSGASQVSRENSAARLSRKGGSGHERSMPSSPMLGHDTRQLSMQSSFEPPELRATHAGGDTNSPLRAGLHSQEEMGAYS